jgi:hypothetical protein
MKRGTIGIQFSKKSIVTRNDVLSLYCISLLWIFLFICEMQMLASNDEYVTMLSKS